MKNLHETGRVLKVGLGLGLVALFALASGCTAADSVDDPEQLEDASSGEAEQAITNPGIYTCTLGGGSKIGSLLVRPDGTCHRYSTVLVGSSNLHCPQGACVSCYVLSQFAPACILDN